MKSPYLSMRKNVIWKRKACKLWSKLLLLSRGIYLYALHNKNNPNTLLHNLVERRIWDVEQFFFSLHCCRCCRYFVQIGKEKKLRSVQTLMYHTLSSTYKDGWSVLSLYWCTVYYVVMNNSSVLYNTECPNPMVYSV